MIEWLTGLAILGGIAVYNNYKTKKEVKHAIEAIDNDIEAAKEDIERIERNQNEYFNNKKLSDWTLRHATVIKTLKSINPDLLQEFSMENKSLDKILTIIEEKEEYRNKFNERYISNELNKHEKYFNDIFPDESLTVEQRHAIVKDEDVNYINAGAGTGKTTTILAKIKYLVEKKNVKEQEILLLAYNTAVSVDINKKLEKMNLPKVKAQTFHGFGNQIVKQRYNKEEQHAPEPFIRKDKVGYIVIDNIFTQLRKNKTYNDKYMDFFLFYLKDYKPFDDFESEEEYQEYLSVNKPLTIKGENVKSLEEVLVANILYKWGIEYEYEKKYEYKLPNIELKTYRPDFYLTDYGIYLEHFALNRIKNQNGDYELEEFFDGYKDEYDEKLKIHKKYKTKLIKTYSYELKEGKLFENLKNQLKENNVDINKRSNDEIEKQIKETANFTIRLFTILNETFLSHLKSQNTNVDSLYPHIDNIYDSGFLRLRAKCFLDLFDYFYKKYQKYLSVTHSIDFEDMINISQDELSRKSDDYFSYKYIFVDEFQDITIARHNLLKTLMHKSKFPKLLVVGDDWQSIYRFSGGEIDVLMNFKKYYGEHFSKSFLTQTFRFGNELAEVSNKFILANPEQEKKRIKTENSFPDPIKLVPKQLIEDIGQIEHIISTIRDSAQKKNTKYRILILNRYKKNKAIRYAPIIQKYKKIKEITVDFDTIHSCKGLTYDFVFVDDVSKEKMGFPSNMSDDSILKMLISTVDEFPYAEERRLFYVAMTRARQKVYMLYVSRKASKFIDEISSILGIACSECGGTMRYIKGYDFYGCSNYPDCDFTINDYEDAYGKINKVLLSIEVKSKSEPKSSPKIVKDYQSNRKDFGLIEFNKRLKKMKDEGKI